MSLYTRDLRDGSAIIIEKRTDKVVATFLIENYESFDEMRIACNKKWDELDLKEIDRQKELESEAQ